MVVTEVNGVIFRRTGSLRFILVEKCVFGIKMQNVGLSMMRYTFGKEKRTCLGDFQLRGLIGKLLY